MRSYQRHVDRKGATARHARILDVSANAPTPLAARDIYQKVMGTYTFKEVNGAITSLRRDGRIDVAVAGNGGWSANTYVATAERRTA